jgi:1,4-dihydroxy-2-naphthoyl-CoA hydrolase
MGDDDFETYDQDLAEIMMSGTQTGGGLMAYLGVEIVEVGPGIVTAEMQVQEEMVHGFGALHGGVVSALVDHVLGSAVFPVVPKGTWPATLEFKINYLAAVRSGVVRATGRVVSLRKRTAVVQVDVTNDDRPVATALGTISLNPPKTS